MANTTSLSLVAFGRCQHVCECVCVTRATRVDCKHDESGESISKVTQEEGRRGAPPPTSAHPTYYYFPYLGHIYPTTTYYTTIPTNQLRTAFYDLCFTSSLAKWGRLLAESRRLVCVPSRDRYLHGRRRSPLPLPHMRSVSTNV